MQPLSFKRHRFHPDIIRQGAEALGWELDDLFAQTITAMQSCEASVLAEL